MTDSAEVVIAAVKTASEEINRAILEAIGDLHKGEDLISQGAKKILKNIMQKRSVDGEIPFDL